MAQPRWAKRSDKDCEQDAKVFTLEFFVARGIEDDFQKLTRTLAEIGAPWQLLRARS
jgi:hypothetical protein